MSEDKNDLNSSTINKQDYENQNKAQRAFNAVIRWTRTTGRAIAYPFKKVGNSLWNGLRGCCLGFKDGCAEGWKAIEFKQSQYGLPKEESKIISS